MSDSAYIRLAGAIIQQARQDYIQALRTLKQVETKYINAKATITEVEQSVRGPGIGYMIGGIDPEALLHQWREEANKPETKRKRKV